MLMLSMLSISQSFFYLQRHMANENKESFLFRLYLSMKRLTSILQPESSTVYPNLYYSFALAFQGDQIKFTAELCLARRKAHALIFSITAALRFPYLVERIELFNNTAVLTKPFPSEHVQVFAVHQLCNSVCKKLYQKQQIINV